MLKGETLKISELRNRCNEKGGASVEITNVHIQKMPNLLVIVGPEEYMKSFNGETDRQNTEINILAEDHTSSFIKAELNTRLKLPSFLRNTMTPILDMSDVVLSAILVSVIDEENIEKVKEISHNNSLFGIDLKKTIQDKEKQRIKEYAETNQRESQENITGTQEKIEPQVNTPQAQEKIEPEENITEPQQ